MPRTIGDDLRKRVLGRDDRVIIDSSKRSRPELVQRSVLLNPKRRALYEFLCRYPCSHVEHMARTLEYPASTVKWHLQKMMENGFIERYKIGKNTVYYPVNLLDPIDLEVLALLNSGKVRHILRCVLTNPGVSQKDLARIAGISPQMMIWYATKLKRLGIVTAVNDGKYTTYGETEFLSDQRAHYRTRAKSFKEFILKKLSNEGLKPVVYRSVTNELSIQMGKGLQRSLLVMFLNPYVLDLND